MPYPRNPHFVGREKELNDLALRLIEGSAVRYPAVISTGIGGVGKSQLAVEFAYQYGRAFPGGVFWISFANPDAAEAEIARSGAGLKLSPHYDRLELAEQLRLVQAAWAEATPRLLIFDNLDDERGSWPAHTLLDKWRPRQGGCRLLVTSRRQTWPTAMGVWSLTLRTLPRHQSQALLNDLTRSGLTARLLDAIADELGDLPLALQLAGSYLHTYRHDVTPQAYLAELRAPGLLAHPSLQGRGAEAYSPTDHDLDVARTFQVSMNRLNPDDAGDMLALDLLLRAARFAPGEPIPRDLLLATVAAQNEAESADPLAAADALRRLSDLGLMTITEKGAARLHRLLARFARELATPAAWEAEIVAAVEAAVINKAYAENTAGYPAALQSWEVHLRVVTDAALPREDDTAATLATNLGYYLQMSGDLPAARPYYERALAISEKALGPDHPDTARSVWWMGTFYEQEGDLDAARDCYKRAYATYARVFGEEHPHTKNVYGFLKRLSD